ncbi:MAG TPA: hypothetical protein VN519_05905 [Bryobacteraceae bacterium]|nr:hypothetical protein [Bryobacteraceae bacterium]
MKSTAIFAVTFVFAAASAWAGPPFQTDDPEPIDYGHYEFYTFASSDGTPVETDAFGPALEFNWGALPNVHLHIMVPAATAFPHDGPRTFGIGDIETGIKYRFVQETKIRPMIGTFVMIELPTGNADRGLGLGKTWYKLPLWIQKSWGPWTSYGGGGEVVLGGKVPGFRNYPFAGWLVQRDLGRKWTLGTEAFFHGPEGVDAPQFRASTLIDFGGYYKFHGNESRQLLFCYGHSVAGGTENYAYLGLYWTWGKDKDKNNHTDKTPGPRGMDAMLGPPSLDNAF